MDLMIILGIVIGIFLVIAAIIYFIAKNKHKPIEEKLLDDKKEIENSIKKFQFNKEKAYSDAKKKQELKSSIDELLQ